MQADIDEMALRGGRRKSMRTVWSVVHVPHMRMRLDRQSVSGHGHGCRILVGGWLQHGTLLRAEDLILSDAFQALPGPSTARTSTRRGGRQSRDIPLHPLPLDAVGSGEHATVGRLSTSVSLDRRGLLSRAAAHGRRAGKVRGERVGAVEVRQGGMEKCRSDNHHRPLWPGRLKLRPGRPDGQGRVRFARHGTLAVPLARCCDSIRLFPRGMPWVGIGGWVSISKRTGKCLGDLSEYE